MAALLANLAGAGALGLGTVVGGAYTYMSATRNNPSLVAKRAEVSPSDALPQRALKLKNGKMLRLGGGPAVGNDLNHRGRTLTAAEEPTAGYRPIAGVQAVRRDQMARNGTRKFNLQQRRPTPYLKSVNVDAWEKLDMNAMNKRSDTRWNQIDTFDDREFHYIRDSRPDLSIVKAVRRARGLHWGYRPPQK